MRITLLGATGFVGQVLLRHALAAGHQVTVLARHPGKLGSLEPRVTVIPGSYFEDEKLARALSGSEAVISAIGPLGKEAGQPGEYTRAMRSLIGAMKARGIRRLVWIGGAPLALPGERLDFTRGLLKLAIDLLWGKNLLQTKNQEYALLAQSGLDWTAIRPPQIIPGRSAGTVLADARRLPGLRVGVEDVAAFLLQQLASLEWVGKAPFLASGKPKKFL